MKKNVKQHLIDNISKYITIFCAMLFVVLNTFNLISDMIFRNMVVALLGLISLDELLYMRKQLESLNKRISNVSNQFSSVEVQKFVDADKAVEYLTKRTCEAQVSIDQASIDTLRIRSTYARQQYEEERRRKILSDSITYRYMITNDKKRRLNNIKEFMNKQELTKLFVAYNQADYPKLPLMSFVIFDKCEIFIRVPYEYGEDVEYLAIKNMEIVTLFLNYYDKLWGNSIKIKSKSDLDALSEK